MKKRHSIRILLAAAALLLATAACTKNELADGDRLPEGQYPLEIARITLGVEGGEAQPWGAPATRVSETADGTGSVFDTGDPFAVQIDDGTETATYTVQDDGTVSSNAPLYWSDRKTHTVTAWYSATDGTLDLSDQTNGLAYLMHGKGRGDYQTPVTLTFTHSLAKVRVTPSDDIANDEVTSLKLYTYTQCTHNQGNDVQGTQEGWINMKKCEYTNNGTIITCWEANVVPGFQITKLIANDDDKERELSASINPVAGRFYNITLDKDKGFTIDKEGNYNVTTAEGLKNVAELVNGGKTDINITLDKNINLTGKEWTPIGRGSSPYTGTFDGGNHTISGLTVTGSEEYAGLFGYIGKDGGTVKNVKLENVQITSDNQYANVGGVAGYSRGNIENCSVSGSVSGNSNSDGTSNCVGGVVGQQYGGTITECSSSAIVEGTNAVGGVAGQTVNATLTACYATGDVTAERDPQNNTYAGGVVGYNGASTLIACYATGNVIGTGTGTGSIYVGGVTGSNDSGTLTACYHAAETVSGPDGATGGVTGRNYDANVGIPSITACYWQNNQAQGIGNNQAGTTDGTTKVADDWTEAMKAMNTALSGTGWQYVTGSGDAPLTLRKQ
ncbi:MAG: GLUG motif-containing protein [Prevotella sp.]|nr:GLUG motif-containing protein [Prevotella sp.]